MNPELEKARTAMKLLAEAKRAGKPLDLASLPEPLRRKLQEQMQRLPPEMQKELLAKGSPILEKAGERAWQNAGVLPGNYSGHFNKTVQAGDRMQLTIGRVMLFFGAAAAVYYVWQSFGG